MTEEEVLAKYSTPSLRRCVLPRAAKKLNMEFDAQYRGMTPAERERFLDDLYGQETGNVADQEMAAKPATTQL